MAKTVKKTSIWDGLEPTTDTHDDVYTHTPTPTPKKKVPPKKIKKDCRIQILTYGDLVSELDDYAASQGISRAEAFEKAVRFFLDSNA